MPEPDLKNDSDLLAEFIQTQLRGIQAREGQVVGMAAGQAVTAAFQRLIEAAGVGVETPEPKPEK